MRVLPIAVLICAVLLATRIGIDAKVLSRQEIVKSLVQHKFSRTFLSNCKCSLFKQFYAEHTGKTVKLIVCPLEKGVCLIENESGGDTKKVSSKNGGVSYQYGVFQIDSREWCGKGYEGGKCKVRCEGTRRRDNKLQNQNQCAL